MRIVTTSLLALAAAAPAQAATLSVDDNESEWSGGDFFHVRYDAAPGEVNRVTASYDDLTNTFTLSDPGAEITLEGEDAQRCTRTSGKVTCTHVNDRVYYWFEFNLGDGDDSGVMNGTEGFMTLDGDAGDDTLTQVGDQRTTLLGGEGADRLAGGLGDDTLWGGLGADLIDGRGGFDEVPGEYHYYSPELETRSTGIDVSLDGVANDGVAGEGDNVLGSNERIQGTRFADVLTGGAGNETLEGMAGDDRLAGRGGINGYYCGAGQDVATLNRVEAIHAKLLVPPQECESFTAVP